MTNHSPAAWQRACNASQARSNVRRTQIPTHTRRMALLAFIALFLMASAFVLFPASWWVW